MLSLYWRNPSSNAGVESYARLFQAPINLPNRKDEYLRHPTHAKDTILPIKWSQRQLLRDLCEEFSKDSFYERSGSVYHLRRKITRLSI